MDGTCGIFLVGGSIVDTFDEPNRAMLREALKRRLHRRGVVTGSIVLPAVPNMVDEYVAMCDEVFSGIGVSFSEEQLHQLRSVLSEQLAISYAASPRSEIVITYDKPVGMQINYFVKAQWSGLEDAYDNWVATREPPYFGEHPDAMVTSLVESVEDPQSFHVLDIGSGTGRNALALARRGHPVDAVELSPKFVDILRRQAKREKLDVRVIQSDVFAATDELRRDYQMVVISEVVSDFRSMHQLRDVFTLAAKCLAPGGVLVFNSFLADEEYIPDDAAIELAQQCYSAIFGRADFAASSAGLPFVLEREESVLDFEKSNLPAESWPPTTWYEGWVSGQDVFDVAREDSPIELRWFVYRRSS